MRDDIVAVVVAYLPSQTQLNTLIDAVSGQCSAVFIMDNGGGREALGAGHGSDTVRCVDMSGNSGLGGALNKGFELARRAGARYVITFDQDSTPEPGMVLELAGVHEALGARGVRVAAVGPRFVDRRSGRQIEYPFMRLQHGWPRVVACTDSSSTVESDFLITSGCLVSLAAYDAIGAFDPELFVDCTDVEWCFRATALGYHFYGVCSVTMTHELGLGQSASVLGLTILSYSPVRRYYYARNTLRLIKLPYIAAAWRLRMLLGLLGRGVLLPLAPDSGHGWKQEWKMFVRGVWDGLRGIGGPMVSHPRPKGER